MPRLAVFALLTLLTSTFAFAQTTQPSDAEVKASGLAVVEIFTSEGCSSCPPAEKFVAKMNQVGIDKDLHLHTLAWHVAYWDYLGWKDIYANKAYRDVQKRYASLSGRKGLWTPHVLVNGGTQLSGKTINNAITIALNTKPTHSIDLSAKTTGEQTTVNYSVKGDTEGKIIRIVLAEDDITSVINAGENKGRTLMHTAVVRDYKEQSLQKKKLGVSTLAIPANAKKKNMTILALVQDAKSLKITGASRIKLPEEKKMSKAEQATKKLLSSIEAPDALAPKAAANGHAECKDGVCELKE